jgi:hypothetical protein
MERPPVGGWEAAIDASLAARLLRPAVRAGISDPAHGRMLAARLQRMQAPSLADDVARRYGSTALDASRPPIVYATPLAPEPPATSAPSADTTVHPGPSAGKVDAVRPIVRALERTTGPTFPPLRPVGATPAMQRLADPALPVAIARQVSTDPPSGAAPRTRTEQTAVDAGAATASRGEETQAASRPVVAAAPTRLQHTLAADRAGVAIFPALPLAHAAPPSRAGIGGSAAGGGGTAGRGIVHATMGDASGGRASSASPASRGTVGAAPGPIGIAQRVVHPAGPPPAVGIPVDEGSSISTPMVVAVVAPARAGAGESDGSRSISPASSSIPPAVVVAQRVPLPADAGALPLVRARPLVTAAAPGGGRAIASGEGAPVQRFLGWGAELGRVAGRLLHAAPAVANVAAPAARSRASASATPPPGAPPAELPTRTAPSARTAPAVNVARLADDVYELLVRRLERERKQRGW